MKKNNYSTGQFARLANVTERTIRYYDKIGLLRPSFVMENGYRKYTQNDLVKLQKIISLKHLGFSLEEIYPMVMKEENIKDSFEMQMNLLDSQIRQLQNIRYSMHSFLQTLDEKDMDWSKMISLIRMSNIENEVVEQYKNSHNLNVRIALHDNFSTNKKGWFPWLYDQIDFSKVTRLLEVGCGNGKLWLNSKKNLRNREIFLTDVSEGMIFEVRKKLGKDFNCMVADCMTLPFKDRYFDAVIANHVMFYIQDIHRGLSEISRVLRQDGFLYCSTYGKNHMKEITEIAQDFDDRINLSQNKLFEVFGLENGEDILKNYFEDVHVRMYEDSLCIDEAQPLVEYIMSCHGNQNEIIGNRIEEFKRYIDSLLESKGPIEVTKEAGLFICRK